MYVHELPPWLQLKPNFEGLDLLLGQGRWLCGWLVCGGYGGFQSSVLDDRLKTGALECGVLNRVEDCMLRQISEPVLDAPETDIGGAGVKDCDGLLAAVANEGEIGGVVESNSVHRQEYREGGPIAVNKPEFVASTYWAQ